MLCKILGANFQLSFGIFLLNTNRLIQTVNTGVKVELDICNRGGVSPSKS